MRKINKSMNRGRKIRMNKNLEKMRNDFIEQVKSSEYVLDAWNFGLEMHGLSDEHSDVDIVLLIEGNRFEAFTSSVES